MAGDDLRFLDWNLYARLDKLFLKLFLEEEDLHFYALMDDSRSMDFGSPTKLHFAKQLAAALGFIGLIRADRVHLETLGSSRLAAGPVLRRQPAPLLEYLGTVSRAARCRVAEGVRNLPPQQRKGIVVLLTDLMDKGGYNGPFPPPAGERPTADLCSSNPRAPRTSTRSSKATSKS